MARCAYLAEDSKGIGWFIPEESQRWAGSQEGGTGRSIGYRWDLLRTPEGKWIKGFIDHWGDFSPEPSLRSLGSPKADLCFCEIGLKAAAGWFTRNGHELPEILCEDLDRGHRNPSQHHHRSEAPPSQPAPEPPTIPPPTTPAPTTATSVKHLGNEPPPPVPAGKPKEGPSEHAFAAYHLWKIGGLSQEDVACRLEKELHLPFDQSKVSRLCAKVKKWLDEGNSLPPPRRISMDPRTLEQGPRRDGRR